MVGAKHPKSSITGLELSLVGNLSFGIPFAYPLPGIVLTLARFAASRLPAPEEGSDVNRLH